MVVSRLEGRQGCARDVDKPSKQLKIIFMLIALLACIAYFLLQANGSEQSAVLDSNGEEAKLESVLEKMQGVGDVKVYFHYDEKSKSNGENELFSQYFRQQATSGQGVSGLLVVAEGAEDVFIRQELAATISRILQLPSHRIVVVPMNEQEDVEQ